MTRGRQGEIATPPFLYGEIEASLARHVSGVDHPMFLDLPRLLLEQGLVRVGSEYGHWWTVSDTPPHRMRGVLGSTS